MLETLAAATLLYGRRNVRMLYDALSTLAEAAGRALGEPCHLAAIMPALTAKWGALSDSDPELLPLLECFMTIATAIGAPLLARPPPLHTLHHVAPCFQKWQELQVEHMCDHVHFITVLLWPGLHDLAWYRTRVSGTASLYCLVLQPSTETLLAELLRSCLDVRSPTS